MTSEASADLYERLVGQTLANRYKIESRIGEGAMGAVYKARHVKVGRTFAVKVLHAHLVVDGKTLQRFEREAELAGRLRHPNVIGVVDVGETPDGLRYMVMDFAEGPDLATLLNEAPMPPPRVINLVRQMLEGLYHAHEAGLIHRDFKPENVIVERDAHGHEVPRIVDFGIAILREGGDSTAGPGRLTTNGLVLGTPHYMAPEQAVADPIDHRIDMFALGIIVYEMLSGKLPFDGSGAEVARANLLLEPPAISERVPYLDADPLLEAFARRLMEKKRDRRPATARAARELLDLIEKDRTAAAAALGVTQSQAGRPGMATQDAQPVRHANGDSTYPPPIRAASEPRAASAVRQPSIETAITEPLGVRKSRAPLVAATIVGIGILAGAALVLLRGGDKKAPAPPPADPAPTIAKVEPAPTPAPSPAPAPAPPEPTPVAPPPTAAVVETPKQTPKTVAPKTPKTTKAGTGSATTTTTPTPTPPPVETAAKPVDARALATQYQQVGAQLKDLQTKKGPDTTSDLWARYRYVNLSSAMATQESRDAAAAILAKLAAEIRTRSN